VAPRFTELHRENGFSTGSLGEKLEMTYRKIITPFVRREFATRLANEDILTG
jgi:hypothetical protein